MQVPDRVIVRKLQEYDPHLFVVWNSEKSYFEIWRRMAHGRRLITPVTLSIYEQGAPKVFCPLDERVLWWLYDADSWRVGGSKKFALESDQRWKEFQVKKSEKFRQQIYDYAKDIWQQANAFYATKHASKNSGKPTFNHHRPYDRWVRPDSQARTSSRLFARTAANARAYGYRR